MTGANSKGLRKVKMDSQHEGRESSMEGDMMSMGRVLNKGKICLYVMGKTRHLCICPSHLTTTVLRKAWSLLHFCLSNLEQVPLPANLTQNHTKKWTSRK